MNVALNGFFDQTFFFVIIRFVQLECEYGVFTWYCICSDMSINGNVYSMNVEYVLWSNLKNRTNYISYGYQDTHLLDISMIPGLGSEYPKYLPFQVLGLLSYSYLISFNTYITLVKNHIFVKVNHQSNKLSELQMLLMWWYWGENGYILFKNTMDQVYCLVIWCFDTKLGLYKFNDQTP